jgi:hypothetical protein
MLMASLAQTQTPDTQRQLLRHTVATLAYRGAKATRGAPVHFADFHASEKTRTPGQIVAHIADLLGWALAMAQGKHDWHDSPPLPWDAGVERFHAALEAFDTYLVSDQPLHFPAEKLFQGPIADALTHVGQLTMLRRMAGAPVRGENYFKADIVAGRVGREQTTAVREFD